MRPGCFCGKLPEAEASLADSQKGNGTSVLQLQGTKFSQQHEWAWNTLPRSLGYGTQPCRHFDFSLVRTHYLAEESCEPPGLVTYRNCEIRNVCIFTKTKSPNETEWDVSFTLVWFQTAMLLRVYDLRTEFLSGWNSCCHLMERVLWLYRCSVPLGGMLFAVNFAAGFTLSICQAWFLL